MTPAEIIPWLTLILSSVAVLGHFKGWVNSGEKKLLDDVNNLKADSESYEKKLIEHDRRIQSVEGELKHLPNREMTHELQIAMERIVGRLDTMDEKLKPIASTNHRLQEFLLEQAQK